ncbi:hypothetical protein NUW54_g2182 [Trametes sanguinea]|uniref:Uncharacterized protein n=1 Tax=Trametes sanguinea TaxID=158606 RepID=A0ACC1Q5K8_9APHY|nr:hypothetical protein NUW54_g2182 [Trametes sanguinea]
MTTTGTTTTITSSQCLQSEVSLFMILNLVCAFTRPGVCCDPSRAEILLQHDPELKKNLERQDFEKILNSPRGRLGTIWTAKQEAPSEPDTASSTPLTPEVRRAVSAAWQEPYTSTGNVLESVLEEYMKDENYFTRHPRYAFITQSSGSGKSRMVDELAKTIFCIPMCLGSEQGWQASCSPCPTLADTTPTYQPTPRQIMIF